MDNIILIGHGSPKKEANTMEMIACLLHAAIHPSCGRECVKVAYLQFAEPAIMDAIREFASAGAERIVVHPFFLSAGMHVTKDIPEMIEEAKAAYPAVEFIYTEPLGIHEKLVDVVLERIRAAHFLSPLDIERRSFEIIAGEADLSRIPEEQRPIVQRVIHTTADFDFIDTLRFHPDAVHCGIAAIRAGKDILTDVEMVRAGINKKLLDRWGGKVISAISDETTMKISEETGKTRSEIAIERGLAENIGIVAIGNAPTALLRVIELFAASTASGALPLVVGVPVGFVKALESKTMLAAQQFPYITNLSRKGGSTVAVAIVNALLKMAGEEQ